MGEYHTNKRPGHKDAKYFVGQEVEHTPAYGLKTLFVVSVHSPIRIVNTAIDESCEHIYFGADNSFNSLDKLAEQWEDMIQHALDSDFWVTVDFGNGCWPGVEYAMYDRTTDMSEYGMGIIHDKPAWTRIAKLMQHKKFIPMVSIRIPALTLMNKNAIIKVDDDMANPKNPGVWCAPLSSIVKDKGFTDWKEYDDDEIIN